MKLTKMVYVASAYTAKNKNLSQHAKKNLERFRERSVTKCIGFLHDIYPYAFIGPITQSYQTAPFTKSKKGSFKYWEKIDLTFVSRCDELWVFTLPGWKESTGVKAEIKFAKAKKIPVKYIDYRTYEIKSKED